MQVRLRCNTSNVLDIIKPRNCGFIEWLDPALCERAKMIIPGLIRSKNKLEEENHRLKLLL
ncbi:hypothetical protein OSB04_006058, partial [Centaurea solstitialis]